MNSASCLLSIFDSYWLHVVPDEINWPEGEDAPPPDAQELITLLLRQNPLERMGAGNNAKSKENVA